MSPELIHTSTRFLIVLADAAGRSLLLGCFVAASLAAFRVRAVETKLLAWRGVLFAALAMPLLIVSFPTVSLVVPVPNLESLSRPCRRLSRRPPRHRQRWCLLRPRRGSPMRSHRNATRRQQLQPRQLHSCGAESRGLFSPQRHTSQSLWLSSCGWRSVSASERGSRTQRRPSAILQHWRIFPRLRAPLDCAQFRAWRNRPRFRCR